jgi:hypothetical protein
MEDLVDIAIGDLKPVDPRDEPGVVKFGRLDSPPLPSPRGLECVAPGSAGSRTTESRHRKTPAIATFSKRLMGPKSPPSGLAMRSEEAVLPARLPISASGTRSVHW